MPRPKLHPNKAPLQPFSLILEPSELDALRKIAGKEKTSVAAIIRRAIHKILYQANPELVDRMIEAEVDGFLKRVGKRVPLAQVQGAKGNALKYQIRQLLA